MIEEEDAAIADYSQRIATLLKKQYQCTEDYCNATTALHNAIFQQQQQQDSTTDRCSTARSLGDLLRAATQRYQDTLHRLQTCVGSLEKLVVADAKDAAVMEPQIFSAAADNNNQDVSGCNSNSNHPSPLVEDRLHQHLARTRRILGSIYHASGEGSSFHANGLPTPKKRIGGNSSSDTNTRLVALATLRASIKSVSDAL